MKQAIFTIWPWRAIEGDPASPRVVAGVPVMEVVFSRADTAGALLLLVDGRYAITGSHAAVGSARQLKRYARRRLRQAATKAQSDWHRKIINELARRAPRPHRAARLFKRDANQGLVPLIKARPRSRLQGRRAHSTRLEKGS